MNPAYRRFLELPEEDRVEVFETTATRLDTPPQYVEKDFWVCLVLDVLFNGLPTGHPKLLFKGGTSLSKVHGLIDRFSEDIDVTVFRTDLKFSNETDPASAGLSTSKRNKLLKRLKREAAEYVHGELRVDLSAAIASTVPDFELRVESDDINKPTLLFDYPILITPDRSAYVQPRVKIESGARSALDPNSSGTVQPFVVEDLDDDWDLSVPNITTIAVERTFWDKVMILHGLRYDSDERGLLPKRGNPTSRHYYDLAMLASTEAGTRALTDRKLMEDVKRHAEIMFGDKRLDGAQPGGFRLVPTGALRTRLDEDYTFTRGMMLGDRPAFDDVMAKIAALEARLNS